MFSLKKKGSQIFLKEKGRVFDFLDGKEEKVS